MTRTLLLEYNPYHGPDGKFTTRAGNAGGRHGRIVRDPYQLEGRVAAGLTRATTGSSTRPSRVRVIRPTDGYMVAVPGHEVKIPGVGAGLYGSDRAARRKAIALVAKATTAFAKKKAGLLRRNKNLYVGTWVDPKDGTLYLDISEKVKTEGEARRLGTERNEIAAWDVVNMQPITLRESEDHRAKMAWVRPEAGDDVDAWVAAIMEALGLAAEWVEEALDTMNNLTPFRVTEGEGGDCGCGCGGKKAGKKGRKARVLAKLAEALGGISMATPKPKRQRGTSVRPPKLSAGQGTISRSAPDYGGDNSVPAPTPVAAPRPSKLVRTPVKRWDGTSKRPRMGGALSAKGRRTLEGSGVLEYNPYHGKGGKFSSKGGAVQTVAYSGKRPKGHKAEQVAGGHALNQALHGSQRLAQDTNTRGDRVSHMAAARQASSPSGRRDRWVKKGDGGKKVRRPEHRERVEQNPKKHVSGPRTRYQRGYKRGEGLMGVRRQRGADLFGSPRLEQDAARRGKG